jgi:hypothetical protein
MFITKKSIPTYKQRKEAKMTKTKNRIKKMTFQKQPRGVEHRLLSKNDKYIVKMSGYRQSKEQPNENIYRSTGRVI